MSEQDAERDHRERCKRCDRVLKPHEKIRDRCTGCGAHYPMGVPENV